MKNRHALQQLPDKALLKMVAETNSSDALEVLMLSHKNSIENIGFRFLKRRVLLEDLEQDVWEEVLEGIYDGSYKESDEFPQWLHTITFRIAKEMARKERNLSYNDEDMTYAENFIAAPEPPEDREEEIRERTKKLRRGQRKVMEKLLLEHKTPKEAAAELEMTENGVRSVCSKVVRKWKGDGYGL